MGQFVAELRVCYGNQGFGALVDRFPAQLCDAVFRHYMIHVIFAGRNESA
jgi:hypothetical protein